MLFLSALIKKRKVHCYCSDLVGGFVERAEYSKDLTEVLRQGFSAFCAFFLKFSTGVSPVIFAETKRFASMEGHFILFGTLRQFEKTFEENL